MASVWIIEDHALYREAVERGLAAAHGRHAVRAFGSCEDALAALRGDGASEPQVVLLDIGLPGMDGLTGLGLLKSLAPAASVLVLTVFEDDDKIFRAVCAGASGYLLKSEPLAQVVGAVDQALAGGAPMNPRVAARVLTMFAKLAPPRRDHGLTARERTVLQCMASGLPRKRIPEATGLNPHTVDFVIRCIYRKLHVNCAAAAVSLAVRERLIGDGDVEMPRA